MPRALIVAGTGAIGFATARRLLAAGWQVTVTGRDPDHLPTGLSEAGVDFIAAERSDGSGLAAVVGDGADLVVDCMCKTAAQAHELVEVMGSVGTAVMISSRAVYVDAAGRHLNSDVPPRFDRPVTESQPTLNPDASPAATRAGYGPNKVAAEQVLLASGHPISVLRPSKVHGPWSRRPREWVFVKRVLDGRRAVLLAGRGANGDHCSAAVNVAALIELTSRLPASTRVLNIADPDVPRAIDIARLVARHLDHSWEEVLLQPEAAAQLGVTPWDLEQPVVLDTSAAIALGYEPVGTYAETVIDEIEWLLAEQRDGRHPWSLPAPADAFFAQFFDYRAEDRFLLARTGSR